MPLPLYRINDVYGHPIDSFLEAGFPSVVIFELAFQNITVGVIVFACVRERLPLVRLTMLLGVI
jgi:hypothetical protein